MKDLPEYARALARRLTVEQIDLKYLLWYEAAFKFAVSGPDDLGPGLEVDRAHEYAVDVTRRRGSFDAVKFEIDYYKTIFVQRGSDAKDKTPLDQVSRDALKYVALAPHDAGLMLAIEYSTEAYAQTTTALTKLFADRGITPLPEYARRFALHVMKHYHAWTAIVPQLELYERVLGYAMAPADHPGLGMNAAEAHEYARARLKRKPHFILRELETIEKAFAKLVAPAAAGGFALSPRAALARARAITEASPGPIASVVVEALERERVLADFMLEPIANGGLGYAPFEVEMALPGWIARYKETKDIDAMTAAYARALATVLSNLMDHGRYDEAEARRQALASLGQNELVKDGAGNADSSSLANVTARRSNLRQRLRDCARLLWFDPR